jgi:hypothetical protein
MLLESLTSSKITLQKLKKMIEDWVKITLLNVPMVSKIPKAFRAPEVFRVERTDYRVVKCKVRLGR